MMRGRTLLERLRLATAGDPHLSRGGPIAGPLEPPPAAVEVILEPASWRVTGRAGRRALPAVSPGHRPGPPAECPACLASPRRIEVPAQLAGELPALLELELRSF